MVKKLICKVTGIYQLYKDIRSRKYFFVTENRYKTDLRKRRELGNAIYTMTNTVLFLLASIFWAIFKYDFPVTSVYVLRLALWVAVAGILLAARNYLTGIYYYLIPWLVCIITFDTVNNYTNLEGIVFFVLASILLYTIFILLLPLHSLRKVNGTIWIFGVLTTLLITIGIEYVLKPSMEDIIRTGMLSESREFQLSDSFGFFYGNHKVFIDESIVNALLNKIGDMPISRSLSRINYEFSLIRSLLLSSYSIGTIIINLKIKLGESKARDIYSRVRTASIVQYVDLRDCIFYGGEKYEDRIMSNPYFEDIIRQVESDYTKYEKTSLWIAIPSKACEFIVEMIKKTI